MSRLFSNKHREGYDTGEDFITTTIRDVDNLLAGEHEQERQELMQDAEYLEWSSELDEEHDRYWSEHCPVHHDQLHDGVCYQCAQEEVRNDH